ncbi:MAG TPA: ABC transporter permease [Symbiobacteriaceae bacterium]|jgi:peptide/nickel transport system permease protein|nr:ABC transporter permease [Symbiobacteriaceae bacterium]
MAAVPARPNLNDGFNEHGLGKSEKYYVAVWRRFRRSKSALFGLTILAILITVAIFAPALAPQKWDFFDLALKNKPPSAEHWFGTDQFGRDVLSRIIWGARISLTVGFVAASVAVLIGSAWGAIAGYYAGSWLDVTMMRIAEAIDNVPTLTLLIVVSSIISRSVFTVMLVIGLTSWSGLAFLVRAQFLSLRERDYVQAAAALGALDRRIIFRHVLPNVVTIIIVNATLRIGGAILSETALNFLGFGAPPPFPTWGEMMSSGRNFMRVAPWITTIPGIFITLTVLSFNFVGDGLRDALDPKMKR